MVPRLVLARFWRQYGTGTGMHRHDTRPDCYMTAEIAKRFAIIVTLQRAGVVKLVDTRDLKSLRR